MRCLSKVSFVEWVDRVIAGCIEVRGFWAREPDFTHVVKELGEKAALNSEEVASAPKLFEDLLSAIEDDRNAEAVLVGIFAGEALFRVLELKHDRGSVGSPVEVFAEEAHHVYDLRVVSGSNEELQVLGLILSSVISLFLDLFAKHECNLSLHDVEWLAEHTRHHELVSILGVVVNQPDMLVLV